MNKRLVGSTQEETAYRYLEENGYNIVCRNFYTRFGEIDIIAFNEGYLCFIEVKFRENIKNGYPQEAVNLKKQKKICNAALWYLSKNKLAEDIPCRFDVVSIIKDEIQIIKNAFDFV